MYQGRHGEQNASGGGRSRRLDFVILLLASALTVTASAWGIHFGRQQKAEKSWRALRKENVITLRRRNRDMAGQLRIPGTNIDYPVMQASRKAPEFYLHRDFRRRWSSAGSLFIDAETGPGKMHCIIYGHHMFSGAMFGRLPRYYGSTGAYRKHPEIIFLRLEGRKGNRAVKETWEVFAACRTSTKGGDSYVHYRDLSSKKDYEAYVRSLRKHSCIHTGIRPAYGEPVMTLSTCSYHLRNASGGIDRSGRFLVAAVRKQRSPS